MIKESLFHACADWKTCATVFFATIVFSLCPFSQCPLGGDVSAAEPENLVANGDFSRVTNGKPDGWQISGDQNVEQKLEAIKDENGRPTAKLTCARCDPGSPSSHAMLAQVGMVRLAKGRVYEFSCRMQSEKLVSRSVSVALQDTKDWTNCGLHDSCAVGSAWTTIRRFFTATRDVGPTGRLQIWFSEPGVLYVSSVRITEIAAQDVVFTDVVATGSGRNLLPNGSFEVGASGWSSLGAGAGWGAMDRLHGIVKTGDAAEGSAFLRIPLGANDTPILYFDYFEPVARRELRPLAASMGWIPVERGAPYTISCMMRASVAGARAVLGVRSKDPSSGSNDQTTALTLSREWKRYSFTFKPAHRYVFALAGPNLEREQSVDVDIDAVQLEQGAEATAYQPHNALELALEPSQDAGIFLKGKPAGLILWHHNSSTSSLTSEVTFQVTDFYDEPVSLHPISLRVTPGGVALGIEIPLPANRNGYYHVRAWRDGEKACFADLRLAIVPPRFHKDSVCGINHAFATARLIHLAAQSGVSCYRDWTLKWQHIEPAKGEFHWEVGDTQINRVLKEGAGLIALMPPFPSAEWSSEAPAGIATKGYPGTRIRQAWAPKDPADLAAFIEKAVGRYRDRIHVWDFLNEPIYTDYSLPARNAAKYGGKAYGPDDYVKLLAIAVPAMRKADPGCQIIGGIGSGPRHLTKEVIEADILKYVDIFNLHTYPGARMPETFAPEMDELLSRMDARGGRKPVWFTEFSYYGADNLPRRPFFPRENSWAEARLLDSERQCADYTVRFFAVMLSHGVQKIFIHSGANGPVNEPDYECALFDYGGAPRKLLPALAVFTEMLGASPISVGERRLGEAGHCAAFETTARSVLAMWTEDESATATVGNPGGADVTWLDAMGNPIAPPVKLTTSLTYLIGKPGAAKDLLQKMK
ncbi:MAG: endo-1,4-beta-xylanase [Candidatus Sumerlaeota bacterium]|nr:endo-1,4-beta-xylanase [Candidatus Sumerlaeota bacterium]